MVLILRYMGNVGSADMISSAVIWRWKMSEQIILMMHPTFGVLALIAAVWVFVDTLNASSSNNERVRSVSKLVAVLMWLTYVVGGYWYVTYYGGDKAIIKTGPWPFAHSLFMEVKEHLFLMLIMLAPL